MLATLITLSLASSLCGTPRHAPDARARVRHDITAPAAFGAKLTRDAFGTFPNERTSTNFVLKWGPDATFAEPVLADALAILEEGWQTQMVDLAHPLPFGAETWKVNAYIGSTGGDSPDAEGGIPYVDLDDDGFAYIVLTAGILDQLSTPSNRPYGRALVVHELYHTIQYATGGYYGDNGYWWWEATADWIVGEVYPGDDASYITAGAWALYPHLPIYFVDYYDEGTIIEEHQYGAFVFARFLSEQVADATLIRDSWVEATEYGDPLDTLDDLLVARSEGGVRDAFLDFAKRLPAWDYQRGETYAEWHEYYVGQNGGKDQRIAAHVDADGAGWTAIGDDARPGAYGISVIAIDPTAGETRRLSLRTADEGSAGTAASFRAFAVLVTGGAPEYRELTLDKGREGSLDVETAGLDELFLVAIALPETAGDMDETFAYEYRAAAPGSGSGDRAPMSCALDAASDGGRAHPGLALAALASALVFARWRVRA